MVVIQANTLQALVICKFPRTELQSTIKYSLLVLRRIVQHFIYLTDMLRMEASFPTQVMAGSNDLLGCGLCFHAVCDVYVWRAVAYEHLARLVLESIGRISSQLSHRG